MAGSNFDVSREFLSYVERYFFVISSVESVSVKSTCSIFVCRSLHWYLTLTVAKRRLQCIERFPEENQVQACCCNAESDLSLSKGSLWIHSYSSSSPQCYYLLCPWVQICERLTWNLYYREFLVPSTWREMSTWR